MSNVYPLDFGMSYRKDVRPAPSEDADIIVITADSGGLAPAFDPETGTTQVPFADGSVEVSFGPPRVKRETNDFDDNLAEQLTEQELSPIAEKLLMGIDQDIQSRSAWLENMSNGISLLGLEVKNPRGAAASGATPAEGVSTVDHPLLLEAVLRFQANARGELLPSDGPVKVRNDGEGNNAADMLAEALEKDMNHYLTKVAKEYYPDTDRMLLLLGFCGISFKKGYHDPIKRRPVIASIDAKDLIVSNAATDIDGAGRVTHRIMMRPSILKRMQLMGAYRDIHLAPSGMPENKNAVDTKIDQIQGVAPPTYVEPADQERELYECYCEIEVPGFEHEMDGKQTGLPLPYKVVIDKDARRILEIRRNWHEEDTFCLPRNRIIAYTFIPGLGFYGIGLLNVLGNSAKAVTAAWRLMIDAGMFANFPGFLYLKSLAKQLTNQFRIPPGGGMPIDTVGADIRASVMPLPYKDPSAVFIQLIDNIATQAKNVGGTAELQIGEGKQDAPVGTTLALIEQATKLMSAVHKRMHQAQGTEFDMLKSLLMEDPEALWRHNKKSKVLALLVQMAGQEQVVAEQEAAEDRHRALFLTALSDCELIPRADPNTSSQTERYLKVVAMRQMAMTNQSIDLNKVDERAFRIMGVDDPESLFKPPPDPNQPQLPPPENVAAQATLMAAQARMADAQTRQADTQLKAQADARKEQIDTQMKTQELAAKQQIASTEVARELVIHRADQEKELAIEQRRTAADAADKQRQAASDAAERENENRQRAADRVHGLAMEHLGNQASARQGVADRAHELIQGGLDRRHEATQSDLDRQMSAQAPQGVLQRAHGGRVEAPAFSPDPTMAMISKLMGAVQSLREDQSANPAVNELSDAVKKLIAMQSAPRSIVRDERGRTIGIKIGDEVHSIVRDARGRVTGAIVEGPQPDVSAHDDGTVTVDIASES